ASLDADDNNRAVLFQDGQTFDLNSLIPPTPGLILTAATDINSSGQIVGFGNLYGEPRAFLLTPQSVPLPNSAALATATLPMALLAGRRFRRYERAASSVLLLAAQVTPRPLPFEPLSCR